MSVSIQKGQMNMIEGPIFSKILRFSIPVMLMGMLQLVYNAADIIVVGRWGSQNSLAAVSSTGSLINLIVTVFMGLSVGASVVISQHYGAGRHKDVSEAVHTAIGLSIVGGIIVGVFGFVATRGMLMLMDTPEDVIDLSSLYVKIYFVGMPANMLYNFGAAILRAIGETKKPLYYLSFSGLINVLLNLVLVIVCKLDVAGVAIATIVSQIISALLVIRCLMKQEGSIKLTLSKVRIYKDKMFNIIRVGFPAGIQGSIFSISNVVAQSAVNFFGASAMAGSGAAANIEGFAYVAMNAIYQAALTFAGQNYGACKYDRIKKVCAISMALVIVIGMVFGLFLWAFAAPLISVYTSVPEDISFGVARMSIIAITYFFAGTMEVAVGMLRGIGRAIAPTIITIISVCGFRIAWIYTVFEYYKQNFDNATAFKVLYSSYPISWVLATVIHLAYFGIVIHKLSKQAESRKI